MQTSFPQDYFIFTSIQILQMWHNVKKGKRCLQIESFVFTLSLMRLRSCKSEVNVESWTTTRTRNQRYLNSALHYSPPHHQPSTLSASSGESRWVLREVWSFGWLQPARSWQIPFFLFCQRSDSLSGHEKEKRAPRNTGGAVTHLLWHRFWSARLV